ncbi:uncharacterized protein STEHIDRAFT_67764, partial [Stereum hirsutum FP-91666 SS1]|uniref:uncharacterized protein n=1 Tax=Stereum hirsutum (strain FP-91666) TaxID=721885 RepID=UPI0004449694
MKDWEANHPPPHILVHINPEYLAKFVEGYKEDTEFQRRYSELENGENKASWDQSRRFFKDEQGLLFFRDANFQPRLCVPKNERGALLVEAHEAAYETAHAG